MSQNNGWETLDVQALLDGRQEEMGGGGIGGLGGSGATTSANVGAFAVPLGTPMRRKFPTQTTGYEKVSHPYMPDYESNDGMDMDMTWAKKMVK